MYKSCLILTMFLCQSGKGSMSAFRRDFVCLAKTDLCRFLASYKVWTFSRFPLYLLPLHYLGVAGRGWRGTKVSGLGFHGLLALQTSHTTTLQSGEHSQNNIKVMVTINRQTKVIVTINKPTKSICYYIKTNKSATINRLTKSYCNNK